MHKLLLLSMIFSLSAAGQTGDSTSLDERSILDLPVGTIVTLDGKSLNKVQKECPNKNKQKYLINGKEEVEVSMADLLFKDGEVQCSGGTDLALIYNDITGRNISLKGKVVAKSPLRCAVSEVTEFEGSVAMYFSPPCSFAAFFKRSLFDFRSVKDLSIKSFIHNVGKHMSLDLDHAHKAPLNVSSESTTKPKNSSATSRVQATQSAGVSQ